jgi:xanthine/uracil/vitamin C permease (AzgA family)
MDGKITRSFSFSFKNGSSMNRSALIWYGSASLAVVAASLPSFMIIASLLAKVGMDPQKIFIASTVSSAVTTLIASYVCRLPLVIGSGITGVTFMTANLLHQGWVLQDLVWLQLLVSLLFLFATLLRFPEFVEKAFGPILRGAVTSALGAFLLVVAVEGAMSSLNIATFNQLFESNDYLLHLVGVLVIPICLLIVLEKKNFPGSYVLAMLASALIGYFLKIPIHQISYSSYQPWVWDYSSLPTLIDRIGGIGGLLVGCSGLLMIQMLDVTGCSLAIRSLAQDKMKSPPANLTKNIFFLAPLGTLLGAAGGSYGITGPHCLHLSSAIGLCGNHEPDYRWMGWMYATLLLASTMLQPWIGQLPFYATLPVLFWVGINMTIKIPLQIKEENFEVIAGWLMVLVTLLSGDLLKGVAAGIWSATFFTALSAKKLTKERLVIGLFLAACLLFN